MFDCLYYSVTLNESKEKCKIVFVVLLARKNIVAPSSSIFYEIDLLRNSLICLSW